MREQRDVITIANTAGLGEYWVCEQSAQVLRTPLLSLNRHPWPRVINCQRVML